MTNSLLSPDRATRRFSLLSTAISSLLASAIVTVPAFADETPPSPGAPAGTTAGAPSLDDAARTTLLGDAGGVRPWLESHGITLSASEVSEVLGNTSGGVRQGGAYDGVTTATLTVDTKKAFGLAGGTFNASALQIHGRNLSAKNLLTLQTASGIEANRATRLWELWYQQAFMDGKFDVRVGQQSLDQEFMTSSNAALFVNTAMGWPLLPSVDLYAGGPAYPLSSLGARVHGEIAPNTTALLGVFDDNPPGGPFAADSQTRGSAASGTRFNLNTGALIIGELQYAVSLPSRAGKAADDTKGLPGTYKIGFWYDTAAFPSQRFDTMGTSLASPLSNGITANDRGNFSVYALFDQVVYRPDPDAAQAVSVFGRFMGAPGDRNLISFSANGGVTLKAPFKSRENDSVGIGFGYGRISNGARGFDVDTAAASPGTFASIRTSESFIEATYQYQVRPWWVLQPDFQYVFRPAGGIINPDNPTRRIGDEAVFGLRTTITF